MNTIGAQRTVDHFPTSFRPDPDAGKRVSGVMDWYFCVVVRLAVTAVSSFRNGVLGKTSVGFRALRRFLDASRRAVTFKP